MVAARGQWQQGRWTRQAALSQAFSAERAGRQAGSQQPHSPGPGGFVGHHQRLHEADSGGAAFTEAQHRQAATLAEGAHRGVQLLRRDGIR